MRLPSGSVVMVSLVPSAEYGAPVTSRTLLVARTLAPPRAARGRAARVRAASALRARRAALSAARRTRMHLRRALRVLRVWMRVRRHDVFSMRTVPSLETTMSTQ